MAITAEDELAEGIEPLTTKERAWFRRFQVVMTDMPERLLLVETADALLLVDRTAARGTAMQDGGAGRAGIVLATISEGTLKIASVSG